MTPLSELLLPIVLSAVAVFLASFVFHMALPWHRDDYRHVPREPEAMDALRAFDIPPGDYMMPKPSSIKEMGTPEFKAKMERGPRVIMTVLPAGVTAMGKLLALWFAYVLIISLFAGYVASRAITGPTNDSGEVMRFASTAAFLGYAGALWQFWIWYSRSLGATIRSTIDGLVYALITGVIFAWLWPK
jgi:hypothetical protein